MWLRRRKVEGTAAPAEDALPSVPEAPSPVLDAAEAMAAATGAAELAGVAETALISLFGCERAALLRTSHDLLVPVAGGPPQPLLDAEVGCAAAALQTGAPRFVSQRSTSLEGTEDGGADLDATSALALPLLAGGELHGVAVAGWLEVAEPPGDDVMRIARTLCAVAAATLARLDLAERMSHVAESDPLTGAHTARSLVVLLDALRDRGTPHALVLIDLDGFGAYNERLGREAGDRLLVALAGMVGGECREGDVVARCGADEFALLLPGSSVDAGAAAARRLVEAVRDWGHEDAITVSAGVAASIADAGADVLALAQGALREARAEGSGTIAIA